MCMEKEFLAVESGFKGGLDEYEGFRQDQEKTSLTIKGIFESLDVWREERGLQRTVGNIAANIGEEIVEYLRAENDEQRVDALCDMFVFSVNGLRAMGRVSNYAIKISLEIDLILKINSFPIISHAFSKLIDSYRFNQRSALNNIVKYSKYQIQYLGYDFLIAMDETLKEIHSRKGAWNDELQKWEKFKTPEAMALWYKADYNKAKVMQ